MPEDLYFDEQSQPLARRWNNPEFTQQGSVDWVDLSRSSIQFSLGILSRLSAASVDPYTITVGHFLGNTFELSKTGRVNIENSLSRLKCFGGVSDVLWFGFGLRHLIRSLSGTEQGALLVALCAALSECFSDDPAAEILHEMTKQTVKLRMLPAVSEWRALVKCCAGIFATTAFPLRMETFMQLRNFQDLQVYDATASPASIADALVGVGNVSRKLWASITILGGREAGWIAAVSEWLFNLTVMIVDQEGNLKYTNCVSQQSPQVKIVYTNSSGGGPHSALQVTDKTFDLRTAVDLFRMPNLAWEHSKLPPVSGRVRWDECLSVTFGQQFEKLMRHNLIVGTLIGSAARIFEAIARAEKGVPYAELEQNQLYLESAYGAGFIQRALHWLPELKRASQSHIHSAMESGTFVEAATRYEASLSMLASSCGCKLCGPKEDELNTRRSIDSHCLVVIFETIITFCRWLSAFEVADNLFPLLRGLHLACSRQAMKRRGYQADEADDIGSVGYILDRSTSVAGTLLEHGLILFTGRDMSELDVEYEFPCAVSSGGICIYLDSLREVSDSPSVINRIHVIPGQIEHNEKPFFHVEDRRVWSQQDALGASDEIWNQLEDREFVNHVKVTVRETARSLEVHYEVLNSRDQAVGLFISPLWLVSQISISRGLVSCDGSHMSDAKATPYELPQRIRKKIEQSSMSFRKISTHTLGRCAASMSHHKMILQEDSCLECCFKAAMKDNMENIIVVGKPRGTELKTFTSRRDPEQIIGDSYRMLED